jgi:FPC/CPF motif-containing protein YcgG
MKKDPSGNKYYFNRDTSVSTFDVPEGLLSKEDYKALKKQVEEIRSKDPAGTWSDDDVPVWTNEDKLEVALRLWYHSFRK